MQNLQPKGITIIILCQYLENASHEVKMRKRTNAFISHTNLPERNLEKDNCNMCKKFSKLEFDHVPPKSTVKIIRRNGFLLDKHFIYGDYTREGSMVQKLGFQAVCGKCNRIGGKYVNGFNRVIEQLLLHISGDMTEKKVCIKVNLIDLYKQTLYMFVVQNNELKDFEYSDYFYHILSKRSACKFITRGNRVYHINKIARIYMGFYTKQDLIYHPDQAICFGLEDSHKGDGGCNNFAVNIKDVLRVISSGECQNMIAFTPFLFRLCIGYDKSKDRECEDLIDISNFTSKDDIVQEMHLDIKIQDIDIPPKSYRSVEALKNGKWSNN